ncbi:MAG: TonB-dependent receptor [Bacteroidetes bacterium]|nr:TonB-dependent receptor [Bacteroidota bacterium]
MKKFYFLVVLLLFPLKIFSQEPDSLFYFPVLTNDSNLFVPKIDIHIIDQKTKEMKTSSTNLFGTASFHLARGKNYSLVISDSSYEKVKKKFSTETNDEFLTDTFHLKSKTVTTNVIDVFGDKEFMQVEDEKMIFNISKMKIDPGPNALELMKRLPMVTVEGESVMLRGSSPRILINGRESEMYGNDLKSIPSDMIEKVEIMTIPPSKYEAEGASGVINIVLKKFEDSKYRVNVSAWASTFGSVYLNQNISYKKNKISIFLNTNEYYNDFRNYFYSSNRNFKTGDYLYSSTDTAKNIFRNVRLNPGVIFDAAKNLYFGLEGIFNKSTSGNNRLTYKEYSYLPGIMQQLFRNTNNDNMGYSVVSYMNKQEITGKDELNLEFNMNNTKYNSDYEQTQFINNVYSPFANGTSEIKNNNNNILLDYTKRFNDDIKLETGFKRVYKNERNNNFSADTSGFFSAGYEFTQNIYSYYGTLSYNNKIIRIKPGARIEYADLRGVVNGVNEFTNFKLDIFPTFSAAYFLNGRGQLQFSYAKKIERPKFNALNPFPLKNDVYNTSTGNPELVPSYTHSFEIKFSKPFSNNFLNANVYFKRNTDLIQNVRYIDSIFTRTVYRNYGYSNDFGTDGSMNILLTEFYNLSLRGGVSKKVFSEDSLNAFSDRISYNGSVWFSYNNPDAFTAGISFYFNKQNSIQSTGKLNSTLNFNFGKYFFNKKMSVNLYASDLLGNNERENFYVSGDYELYSRNKGSMGRSIGLSINFSFGNYDEERQKGKDIKGDDYGE